jgi:glutamate-1-semialdehyde 2,1-aminomutase
MSFGAPTRLENELAELIISNHKYIEKIRFVNSGTEATMSAIRLARGYTKRDKIMKFEGCYHGHVDGLLVNAGSGLVTLGTSSSAGVPENYVSETIVIPLNNMDAVNAAFEEYKDQVAAVIIEPIPANNGLLLQGKEFLTELKEACHANGTLLIFDEVISGFRVGFEGAAGVYDIQPDLFAFGKIIGGGMPVGAYAGSDEIMNHVAPLGPVYQAGTLSGNPVAMAAGIAQLTECLQPLFYEELGMKTEIFTKQICDYAESKGYNFTMVNSGSIFWLSFDKHAAKDASQIDPQKMPKKFKTFHASLLDQGVYIGPSGYEVGFISSAHTDATLNTAIKAFQKALDDTYQK